MSTTIVETSPVWVYRLLSEGENLSGRNDAYIQKLSKGNRLSDNFDMEHKCASLKPYPSGFPPPKGPALPPPKAALPPARASVSVPPASTVMGGAPPPAAASKEQAGPVPDPVFLAAYTAAVEKNPPNTHLKSQTAKLDYFCEILTKLREPIAIYEAQRGIPRTSEHTFLGLVTALAQQSYRAILTIFTMLINLLPLAEGFLYMLSFILDKSIEICKTPTKKDKAFKLAVFAGELVVIFFMSVMILGVIIVPVLNLFSFALFKMWAVLLSN